MRRLMSLVLASASSAALASPALAQPAAAPEATAPEAMLGEIVVTARRRSESLQEVPQVVNAVTSDTLQKLKIQDFRDVQSVVPGLSLTTNSAGFSSAAAMRGVTFESITQAQPTVAFYLNDAPVQANFLFQTMYDIGQVEVLRGPQGTTRGVAAPSGAITVTTRKPNLSEFGGYIDATATDLQRRNLNGAINIPLIQDVLGVRVAGLIEQNDVDGVRSLYNPLRPRSVSSAFRVSVGFEPSDVFNAELVYSHMDRALELYMPVTGPGFPGLTPPIAPLDRVSVQDAATESRFHFDVVSAQLESRVFGQRLVYIGGYARQHNRNDEDRDWGQNLVGVPFYSRLDLTREETSHEIRIESERAPDRFFDYTVGGFYSWSSSSGENVQTATFLPPAFGSPAAPNLAAFQERFRVPLIVPTVSTVQDTSVFGSVTFHLGSKTELTGGLRYLWAQTTNDANITLGDGLTALPIPCASAGLRPGPQPGLCIVPGGRVVSQPPQRRFSEQHTIYNVSLSHRFTRDFMVYGNVGTSYRPPYSSTGILNASNDPVLSSLQIHPSEKSRAFEVGFKWSFLEGRGRLNAALFRQKFKDLPTFVPNVPYVANNGQSIVVQNFNFTADPDATVDGFDLDGAFQITPNWSVSAQVSYADGRVDGGDGLPCNDSNFDGQPDNGRVSSVSQFPPGVFVAICPGGSVSRLPYWNATIQSEYVHPVRDNIDAYVRGLLTYYPENARQQGLVVDPYALLNLFAGLRASDGSWEVGLFARNALKTEELTSLSVTQLNNVNSALTSYPTLIHNSGYFEKTLTPRREVGINVRYAFGSR